MYLHICNKENKKRIEKRKQARACPNSISQRTHISEPHECEQGEYSQDREKQEDRKGY